jgi:hypothetical protein
VAKLRQIIVAVDILVPEGPQLNDLSSFEIDFATMLKEHFGENCEPSVRSTKGQFTKEGPDEKPFEKWFYGDGEMGGT